eukprot:CAMPEP_0171103130 /NCGR_PEP_ID=MMETSP0766_2-20121228/58751_1 /TAXON_ID=439317 /ORGANISM="Gambierdiscus australes, Strain CAWD 149" /LENGTH=137 /DNA_ID=CAMNT_0011563533 /DNA_START=108 /DNA_END=521 /DNA_ORIENTATION=-
MGSAKAAAQIATDRATAARGATWPCSSPSACHWCHCCNNCSPNAAKSAAKSTVSSSTDSISLPSRALKVGLTAERSGGVPCASLVGSERSVTMTFSAVFSFELLGSCSVDTGLRGAGDAARDCRGAALLAGAMAQEG